jgi:hypothetical protein
MSLIVTETALATLFFCRRGQTNPSVQ